MVTSAKSDQVVKTEPKFSELRIPINCVSLGPGSLTRVILARNVRQLIVIEKDKRFAPPLEMLTEASSGRMSVIWGDVLSHNLAASFPVAEATCDWNDRTPNIHIIGNLPFNIATPLLIRWLKAISEK